MNDLFAHEIMPEWIEKILNHCKKYVNNNYVFQTKNPENAWKYIHLFPKRSMIGTTIETDRDMPDVSKAPNPLSRLVGINKIKQVGFKTFITIEPIMDFSNSFATLIADANPDFVNIGADSKGCKLVEPTKERLSKLISDLQKKKVTIRKKVNLKRLGF
jgi:DNA repair photolyase